MNGLSNGLEYKVFVYGNYEENDYLDWIKESKFGIWIGRHELRICFSRIFEL